MICKKCGAEFEDELNVCPQCGIAIENPEDEPVETEDIVEETVSAEDTVETEEYSEDELELVEDDEDYEEDFEVDLYDGHKKLPKAFKIIAIIVAALIVIAAAAGVFYGVIRPDIDSPIASWFEDNTDTNLFVYTKQTADGYGIYVGETQLVNFGENPTSFEEYTEFVNGKNNIYYIDNTNNTQTLYWYKSGAAAPVKIADNVDRASIVMSANEKRILFTSSGNSEATLYSYIAGKSPSVVTTLSCPVNAFYIPHYGFAGDTSKIWYINAESAIDNGELYVGSYFGAPKLKYSDIGSVIYLSSDYDALVYTVNKGENIELNVKVEGKDPILMRTDFNGATVPAIINSPNEGVAYVAQGNDITNTLFFQPFDGSEAKIIDTGVTEAMSVWDLNETTQQIPYFVNGAFVKKTDALLVFKGSELLVSRGANAPQALPGISKTVAPAFSADSNTAAYVINGSKLMLTTYDGNIWSTPVTVADSISSFRLSESGKSLAYTVKDSDGTYSVYVYDIKSAQSKHLISNAVSNIEFVPGHPDTLLFVNGLDPETYSATLYYYKAGNEAYELAPGIIGLTQQANRIMIMKPNAESDNVIDFYTLDKSLNLIPVATSLVTYNSY